MIIFKLISSINVDEEFHSDFVNTKEKILLERNKLLKQKCEEHKVTSKTYRPYKIYQYWHYGNNMYVCTIPKGNDYSINFLIVINR